MTKNLYYRFNHQRENLIKDLLIGLIMTIASWPSFIVETFTRKNFGERYFTLYTTLIWTLLLLIIGGGQLYALDSRMLKIFEGWWVLFNAISLVAFAGYFFITGWRHRKEITKSGQTFTMDRFSRYSGQSIDLWYKYESKFPFKVTGIVIEKYLEGTLFMILGLIGMVIVFTFQVGLLLFLCGLIHLLYMQASYYMGRQYVLNLIDERISNEEMHNAFVEEKPASETRGFRVMGVLPPDKELREQLYEQMIVEEPEYNMVSEPSNGQNKKDLWT